ncbi:MAG: hypothetical protein HY720_25820 [Planctomycetes bacterium]|nr:hypothetical protein [Planctomycetota bacterium]
MSEQAVTRLADERLVNELFVVNLLGRLQTQRQTPVAGGAFDNSPSVFNLTIETCQQYLLDHKDASEKFTRLVKELDPFVVALGQPDRAQVITLVDIRLLLGAPAQLTLRELIGRGEPLEEIFDKGAIEALLAEISQVPTETVSGDIEKISSQGARRAINAKWGDSDFLQIHLEGALREAARERIRSALCLGPDDPALLGLLRHVKIPPRAGQGGDRGPIQSRMEPKVVDRLLRGMQEKILLAAKDRLKEASSLAPDLRAPRDLLASILLDLFPSPDPWGAVGAICPELAVQARQVPDAELLSLVQKVYESIDLPLPAGVKNIIPDRTPRQAPGDDALREEIHRILAIFLEWARPLAIDRDRGQPVLAASLAPEKRDTWRESWDGGGTA